MTDHFFKAWATQPASPRSATMSTATPKRRRQDDEDEDEDEEDADAGADEEEGQRSSRAGASKRVRVGSGNAERGGDDGDDGGDDDDDDDDDDEQQDSLHDATPPLDERPLLPDSFRRSPKGKKGKGKGRNAPPKHQPGSIVRVTLTNFVTYTKAEFRPGPNLNMILGPNGTGKSTLVCAICIGMASSTKNLGRAKDVGEFVKHGEKRALIDIELAADPARQTANPLITTTITREGNKTEFSIDGMKSSQKAVQDFARSFSIHLDNLCQFLPQDRVVDFAALSPVNLLAQTQRAAAPEYMAEWHDQLKTMRKEQKEKLREQQAVTEHVKSMESRQRLQEGDVQRLRERSDLQARLAALEKFRPFPAYKIARAKYEEARVSRKTADKELKRLERAMEPNLRAVNEKKDYLKAVEKVVDQRMSLVTRGEGVAKDHSKKYAELETKLEECATEIQANKESMRKTRADKPRLKLQKADIEKAMQRPPADFDPAQMNERTRDLTRQIRSLNEAIDGFDTERHTLAQQGLQRKQLIADAEKRKENLHSQEGRQADKLKRASPQTAAAWEWIKANRDKFEGEVYGPPMVECNVKDPRHANAVESMLGMGDLLSFTVTNQRDFKTLGEALYGRLQLTDINIRSCTMRVEQFRPPCSDELLRALGLEDWLLSLVEGPEPVLAMLCDNKMIHATGYSSGDPTAAQHRALESSQISAWVTASSSYLINRRRDYGDRATSTRVNPIRQAKNFTDSPVDHQAEAELDREIREARGEIEELKAQITELDGRRSERKERVKELEGEKREIEREKADKQRAVALFNGLPVRLQELQDKLTELNTKLEGSRTSIRAIEGRANKICLEKGQCTLHYANALDTLRGLHVQLLESRLLAIEAKSDLQHLEARHKDETAALEARRLEVATIRAEEDSFLNAGRELREECNAVGRARGPLEESVYDEVDLMTPDALETETQSVQARLEMTAGGNEGLIREYEERARKIARKGDQLAELDASLSQLEDRILSVRQQWEPQLEGLVSRISAAFADNFARIQCAGEVGLHTGEDEDGCDFEHWAIEIRVKFRENEGLSVLDNHRQSGGERAVSTIFYLMALQSLARAPFRVVDEINQGMDPRNERLVHSRLVDIACSPSDGHQTSQYFLITPKLLNGLKYHENMKVHCIANGEYMPEDYRELDFAALAGRAVAVRGRA